MSSVPFMTPVNYRPESATYAQSAQNFVENYFSLWGEVAVLQADGITVKASEYHSSFEEMVWKTASYVTLVIPAVMLAAKVGLRLYFNPVVWVKPGADESLDVPALPSLSSKICALKDRVLEEKKEQLFWIPHPKFEEENRLRFPDNKVNFFQFNRPREIIFLFGYDRAAEGRALVKKNYEDNNFGSNNFFKWLNQDTDILDKEKFFDANDKCFMNCCDFVFTLLHQADLLTKDQIVSLYKNEVANRIDQKDINSNYFGLNINELRDFDTCSGARGEVAKPGDLIIGMVDGEPAHMMLLTEKNAQTEQWKGVGLWNVGSDSQIPTNLELKELQRELKKGVYDNKRLTFKYCSLERALEVFKSKN